MGTSELRKPPNSVSPGRNSANHIEMRRRSFYPLLRRIRKLWYVGQCRSVLLSFILSLNASDRKDQLCHLPPTALTMATLDPLQIPHLTATSYKSFTTSLQNYDTTDYLIKADETLGQIRYVRAPYVDISSLELSTTTSQLTIYADTIEFGVTNKSPIIIPHGGTIQLFGRAIFRRATPASPAKFKALGDAVILLNTTFYGDSGKQTTLSVETTAGVKVFDTNFAPGSTGWSAVIQTRLPEPKLFSPIARPVKQFDAPSLTDQIDDDGVLRAIGFGKIDHLSRMLRYQMLLATAWQEKRPEIAIDIARYVARITFGIGKAVELHLQASTFLSSAIVAGTGRFTGTSARFVPSIDLASTGSVLKARLVAATAFDQSYQAFVSMQVSSTNLRTMANVALQASEDTQESYEFIGQTTKKRYDEAEAAFGKAQLNFQARLHSSLQGELGPLQDTFKQGVQKWKEKMILKSIGEALLAVVAVIGSIAAAVVVPPAGAAGIAAAGAAIPAIASGGAKVAGTAAKMAQVIIKLKDLFEKMQPILEKINELIAAIQKIVALVDKIDALNGTTDAAASGFGMPSNGATDVINLGVQWDEFSLDTDFLMKTALEEEIDGAAEYHLALKKMPIRAKAVLAAQSAVTQAADEHIKTVTWTIAAQKQTDRLRAAIDNLIGSPNLFKIFKESLLERLLATRTWIHLDFYSYLSAYMYYSLDTIPPIHLDPTKQITAYNADAALLQAAVAQSETKTHPQCRVFKLDSLSGVFGDGWKGQLSSERSITFSVDPASAIFAPYTRLRVRGVRCYLEGVSTTQETPLRVGVAFDGRLADKNISEDQKQVFFVTPPRSIVFEYIPSSNEIVMDGRFARPDSLLKPTPFTTWTVSVLDPQIDLGSVSALRFELSCEVTVV